MMPSPEFINRAKALMPELLRKISAQSNPITIPIVPESDAVINSCFYNVRRKVARDGGKPVYGWALRLTQHILEAEKHAIWLGPEGNYVDITPPCHVEAYTAFVIDNSFVYDGQVIDNVRLNMTNNKLVDDLIAVNEVIGKAWAYGRRTGEHEVALPEIFKNLVEGLETVSQAINHFLDQGATITTPCFCGSQHNYQYCHGKDVQSSLVDLWSKTVATYNEALKRN